MDPGRRLGDARLAHRRSLPTRRFLCDRSRDDPSRAEWGLIPRRSEKCVFRGACPWNCRQPLDDDPVRTSISFRAGADGLHSTEN